jgi:hypothetical protein
LERHGAEVLGRLQGQHRRELDDNPQGMDMLAHALTKAMAVGLVAQAKLDGVYPSQLEAGPGAWNEWHRAKLDTLEGRDWPDRLAETDPDAVARAGDLMEDAATELGFHGRGADHLREAGEQAAEAAAALVRSLVEPEAAEPEPIVADFQPLGSPQPDGTVQVATTANQAEAEFVQGLLQSAGIPSTSLRGNADVPHLAGGGGARSIYVPRAAAQRAQLVLSRQELPATQAADPATGAVGLERTGLRLAGKAAAALILLGFVIVGFYGFTQHQAVVGWVAVGALVVVIVLFSERNRE